MGNRLRVMNAVNASCEWVVKKQGVATRKWDGQPLLFQNNLWYKRYTGHLGDCISSPTRVLALLASRPKVRKLTVLSFIR